MCLPQDAGVRQAAATALLTLYNADDNVSPLHAFTARFSTRFAELVYDVDEGVAVKGVRQRKCMHSKDCRHLIYANTQRPGSGQTSPASASWACGGARPPGRCCSRRFLEGPTMPAR